MEPKLHIETLGDGPALLLAHGFGGSARNFRPQAKALSDAFKVVTYDARGHARSEAPADAALYSLSHLVSDFARVAEQASATPLIAGGLSLGAATALDFALQEPERVRALVLAAYPSGTSSPASPRRSWALAFADTIGERGLDAAGSEFVWGARSRFDPRGAELIRQGFLEHAPHALQAVLRGVLAELAPPQERAAELARLDIPVLIVVGADDQESLPPCRDLARLLPRAELSVVADAGHVVNLIKPAEFNARVREFALDLGGG